MTHTRLIRTYRAAVSGHPPELWHLAALTVINRMGTMVFPFLSVYLTTIRGFDLSEAGLLAGAFGIGSLGGSFFGGKSTDRWGARAVITFSLLVGGVFLILLQFAEGFWGFWILIALGSLFGESYRPALSTAVGYFVKRSETGRAMALLRIAIHLGMSIAPAIGGFVAAEFGYKWLFWIDGSTCILGSLYFLYISRNWAQTHRAESSRTSAKKEDIPHEFPHYRTYLLFLLATFLIGLGFVQIFHSLPVFLKGSWGLDERYIGILMASSSILTIIVELPFVHSLEKNKKTSLAILVGSFLLGSTFLPLLLPANAAVPFLTMLLWTFGAMMFLPFNNAVPIHMAPPGKTGTYMAQYWMTWSLTNILAPTAGLWLIEHIGFSSFWLIITALGWGSVLIFARLQKD